MIITIDLTWLLNLGPSLLQLFPYFLLGFGIGIAFYYMFYYRNDSSSKLDRMKHDLEVKKEWIRMISEQSKEKAKKAAWNSKFARTR
jgi:type II secretory pathway component PulF